MKLLEFSQNPGSEQMGLQMFSRELIPSIGRTEGAVCGHFQTSQPSPQPGQRQEVLFIGNTFWHQMHRDMQTLWEG